MGQLDNIDVTIEGVPHSAGINSHYVKEAFASLAYYNGKITEKEACDIIRSTRREFEESILPKFGLSVIGGTQEDIELETEGL